MHKVEWFTILFFALMTGIWSVSTLGAFVQGHYIRASLQLIFVFLFALLTWASYKVRNK